MNPTPAPIPKPINPPKGPPSIVPVIPPATLIPTIPSETSRRYTSSGAFSLNQLSVSYAATAPKPAPISYRSNRFSRDSRSS